MEEQSQTVKNRNEWILHPQVASSCLVNLFDKAYILTALHTFLKPEDIVYKDKPYLRVLMFVRSDVDFASFCSTAYENLLSKIKRSNVKKLSENSLKKFFEQSISSQIIVVRGAYSFIT